MTAWFIYNSYCMFSIMLNFFPWNWFQKFFITYIFTPYVSKNKLVSDHVLPRSKVTTYLLFPIFSSRRNEKQYGFCQICFSNPIWSKDSRRAHRKKIDSKCLLIFSITNLFTITKIWTNRNWIRIKNLKSIIIHYWSTKFFFHWVIRHQILGILKQRHQRGIKTKTPTRRKLCTVHWVPWSAALWTQWRQWLSNNEHYIF